MTEALTYRMENGYRIPNLTVPEEGPVALGRYALLRKKYHKNHRRVLYLNFLTAGTLNQHLMEIERTAQERMELITSQMAATRGVTEELKASDQMKWVGMMNNIRLSAEETIKAELIYA
ncbi:MAG: TnpV protein [Oscillospiraceae bacterium]|nr:TnpV protein [Oscillospiraceae bacterium]